MGTGEPLSAAREDPAFALLRRAAAELGVRAWAVGGYVRDTLLGRPHPDLDVVVEGGRALELAERFAELAGVRPPVLFPRFGTAQVSWDGRLVEFASARAESYAPDSRKPVVRPAPIEEDLARRDFTVNAMLLDLEGRLIDLRRGRAGADPRLQQRPVGVQQAGAGLRGGTLQPVQQPLVHEGHLGQRRQVSARTVRAP